MLKKPAIYDAHFQFIGQHGSSELDHGITPAPFSADDYRARMSNYGVLGGTLIADSCQSNPQFMSVALTALGEGFVGIVQADPNITGADIQTLSTIGVRGIRFNCQKEGSAGLRDLPRLAARVYDIAQWHVELSIDARELSDWITTIAQLPRACIDHLGLSEVGFKHITQLIERDVYIKATGFGRLDFNATAALINLYSINPKRLVFGTDLPSLDAPIPYSDNDYELIVDTFGENKAKDILYQNALTLYGVNLNASTLSSPSSQNAASETADFQSKKSHLKKLTLKRFLP